MNRLNLKTHTSQQGAFWYTLTGDMTDSEGKTFSVAEGSSNRERMTHSLAYYVENFTPIQITTSQESWN